MLPYYYEQFMQGDYLALQLSTELIDQKLRIYIATYSFNS